MTNEVPHLVTVGTKREGDIIRHPQELSERHTILTGYTPLLHSDDGALNACLIVSRDHDLDTIVSGHVVQHHCNGGIIVRVGILDRLHREKEKGGDRDGPKPV